MVGFPLRDGVHRAARPVGQLVHASQPVRPVVSEFDSCDHVFQSLRRHGAPCRSPPSAGFDSPSSGRVRRESLDAQENPPKETPCQVALGQRERSHRIDNEEFWGRQCFLVALYNERVTSHLRATLAVAIVTTS